LLDFLSLLYDRLFHVALAAVKEFAQFRTNDEESTRHHGTRDLQEQKSGTWISVSVSRLLECNRQSDELTDGKQDEQCAEKMTHWWNPPLGLLQGQVEQVAAMHYFMNF
jgi:hypothetical protein